MGNETKLHKAVRSTFDAKQRTARVTEWAYTFQPALTDLASARETYKGEVDSASALMLGCLVDYRVEFPHEQSAVYAGDLDELLGTGKGRAATKGTLTDMMDALDIADQTVRNTKTLLRKVGRYIVTPEGLKHAQEGTATLRGLAKAYDALQTHNAATPTAAPAAAAPTSEFTAGATSDATAWIPRPITRAMIEQFLTIAGGATVVGIYGDILAKSADTRGVAAALINAATTISVATTNARLRKPA